MWIRKKLWRELIVAYQESRIINDELFKHCEKYEKKNALLLTFLWCLVKEDRNGEVTFRNADLDNPTVLHTVQAFDKERDNLLITTKEDPTLLDEENPNLMIN